MLEIWLLFREGTAAFPTAFSWLGAEVVIENYSKENTGFCQNLIILDLASADLNSLMHKKSKHLRLLTSF